MTLYFLQLLFIIDIKDIVKSDKKKKVICHYTTVDLSQSRKYTYMHSIIRKK